MTDTPIEPTHIPLCGCGSCREAADAALRSLEQLMTHQCLHWFIAVSLIHWQVTKAVLESNPDAIERALCMEEWTNANRDYLTRQFNEAMARAGVVVIEVTEEGATIQ